VGTRSHAARSNNCRAAILAANKQTASCAPPSTASCLRPTFTRSTYSPKPVAARRFSHQAMNLLECGGNRSATSLSSGSPASRTTWRTGGSHQVGKSAVAASLSRHCPKKCDKTNVAESIQATTRKRRSSESRKRFERNNCSEVSSVSSRALRKLSIAA